MRLALLLTLILTLLIAAQTYAQPGKLIVAGSPQPASINGYHRGHCVALPKRIRICKLLSDSADVTTDWRWGTEPKRGGGLYLVGQWWRYKSGELVPLNRNTIARRYLFRFAYERGETWESDRKPYQWLTNRSATAVTTEFITGASTSSKGGAIQAISKLEKSAHGAVQIIFKPDGEQTSTLLYPNDEESAPIDRYIGDATSGRIYPHRYLPSDPEKWLSGKRATLRTYDENKIEVLWIEPQKSTKATK